MVYINGKYEGELETVDQFTTYKEARKMLAEYRAAFGGAWDLWLSQRSTKAWRVKK